MGWDRTSYHTRRGEERGREGKGRPGEGAGQREARYPTLPYATLRYPPVPVRVPKTTWSMSMPIKMQFSAARRGDWATAKEEREGVSAQRVTD